MNADQGNAEHFASSIFFEKDKNNGLDKDYGWNTVRAISPISKFNFHDKKSSIAGYFEIEILNKKFDGISIVIGFCEKKFPLEQEMLGDEYANSIGIKNVDGIYVGGSFTKFGKYHGNFKKGDFVGIGVIHKPNLKMEYFATCNRQLLGKVELPTEFAAIQLFPAVSLYGKDDKISANFGKHDWRFKEFEHLLEENAGSDDE